MPTPNIPIVNEGLSYVNGLQMSAGALNADNLTTATLVISAGQCRDSTDTNDINLSAAVTLNPVAANTNKVNGLDTGTIAIDLLYAVYVIADSTGYRPSGSLLSLSFTNPQLPFGYDMFRRVGTVLTGHANARFVYFHQRGNGAVRDFWYAVPIQVLNAGVATTVTAFNWTSTAAGTPNVVPITASKAYAAVFLNAAAAARNANFIADAVVPVASAPSEAIVQGTAAAVQVANIIIGATSTAGVMPMLSAYYTSNADSAVTVNCQGFQDLL